MVEGNDIHQFLTFRVDEEIYAINVAYVREVLEFTSVTRVPRMPAFMRGIINLRGSVVPVIDLRIKFGLSKTEKTIDTSVVVTEMKVDNDFVVMGLLTDSVEEVIDLLPSNIEPPPRIGTKIESDFIQGMGKINDDFIIVLNIDRVLDAHELEYLAEAQKNPSSANEALAAT
jgi:purine-binding chemotaxis protein CheW